MSRRGRDERTFFYFLSLVDARLVRRYIMMDVHGGGFYPAGNKHVVLVSKKGKYVLQEITQNKVRSKSL